MPTRHDLASRAAALNAAGTPYVWATVVRAARPTSAKPGDSAIVLGDGQLDGFVGGDCAEATVRAQALEVLAAGQTRLLRITPDALPDSDVPDAPAVAPAALDAVASEDGLVQVHNPCLSGGTLDIFLEPSVPLPMLLVYGHAPIATALLRADRMFGQQVRALTSTETPLPQGISALVVASHGNDEVPVLTAALRAGVPYVGLVASRKRGPAVLAALPVDDELRAWVHTPAGLDIGAHTAPEVALSILAEIVAIRAQQSATHNGTAANGTGATNGTAANGTGATNGTGAARSGGVLPAAAQALTAIDPVCGMTVAAVATSPHVESPDATVYFCGTDCRTAYLDNPAAYATGT